MTTPSPHSATIERMRRARNVPTTENRKTWTPATTAPPTPVKIHPRLWRLRRVIRSHLGLRDVREILGVIDELHTLLARCGYHVRLKHAQRAWQRQRGAHRADNLLVAGPKSARGRPRGSEDFTQRQLALGLATIWWTHVGASPVRRVRVDTSAEYGPYLEFVNSVMGVLPVRVLARRKGQVPGLGWLVRISIDEFRAAQARRDDHGCAGLIDEQRWLGAGPTSQC